MAIAPSEQVGGALIAERAYRELRDRIVTLRLAPGTALREDELMAELGIGRTPLREAVKRLALEGFVAVQPRRGTYVTGVDAAEIVHITELRAELEAYAAALAARRMDAATRLEAADLLEQVARLARDDDHEALMQVDRRIHAFVWAASGNPYLVDTLERFRECFYRPLLSSTENFDRWTRNGGLDAAARAEKIWRETLEAYEPPPIDEAVRAQLQEFVARRRKELGD